MDQRIALVEFSLTSDNFVLAAGERWRRGGAIPMGGPFSACIASVDVHCVWRCKKMVSKLQEMGRMTITETRILRWTLATGDGDR